MQGPFADRRLGEGVLHDKTWPACRRLFVVGYDLGVGWGKDSTNGLRGPVRAVLFTSRHETQRVVACWFIASGSQGGHAQYVVAWPEYGVLVPTLLRLSNRPGVSQLAPQSQETTCFVKMLPPSPRIGRQMAFHLLKFTPQLRPVVQISSNVMPIHDSRPSCAQQWTTGVCAGRVLVSDTSS